MKRIPAVLLLGAVVVASPTITGCDEDPAQPAVEAVSATTTTTAATGPPTTTDPTPPPSSSATESLEPAGPPVLTTKGLERGPLPGIVYAHASAPDFLEGDWELVQKGGATSPLPDQTYGDFVPREDGGLIGSYGTEAGVVVEVVDGDGTVTTVADGLRHYGLATTPDGTITAYLEDDGTVTTLEAGGDRVLRLGTLRRSRDLAAIIGSVTCQETPPEGGGCSAFVNTAPRSVQLTSTHGIQDSVPGLVRATDADARFRVIGLTKAGRHPCGGLLSRPGKLAWQTCDYTLESFAPDDRHVLGLEAASDTGDAGGIAVLDLKGRVVHAWGWDESASRRITDVAWEDDSHLLAVVYEKGRWDIVRLGIDGSAERAAGPVRVRGQHGDYAPYLLPLT